MLFLARRRLWLALKLTAAAFVALNVYRITQDQQATAGLVTLGLAIGAFAVVWVVLWGITRAVERHRALHPAPPRPLQQRPRWRL
jgi:hypothetical protein